MEQSGKSSCQKGKIGIPGGPPTRVGWFIRPQWRGAKTRNIDVFAIQAFGDSQTDFARSRWQKAGTGGESVSEIMWQNCRTMCLSRADWQSLIDHGWCESCRGMASSAKRPRIECCRMFIKAEPGLRRFLQWIVNSPCPVMSDGFCRKSTAKLETE